MPDVLMRFTPTPFESAFEIHGATVNVATNCKVLADRLRTTFAHTISGFMRPSAFVWRVVVEPDDHPEVVTEFLSTQRLSHGGLAFVTIGRRNFFVCDLQAQEGVSFICECLAYDENLFRERFLPALASLVEESLAAAS